MKRLIIFPSLLAAACCWGYDGTLDVTIRHRIKTNGGTSWYSDNENGTHNAFQAASMNHVTDEYTVRGFYTCNGSQCETIVKVPNGLGYLESITMFRYSPIATSYHAYLNWAWGAVDVEAGCYVTIQTAGGSFQNPVVFRSDNAGYAYWTTSAYNNVTNAMVKLIRCTVPRNVLFRGFGKQYTWKITPSRRGKEGNPVSVWSEGYFRVRANPAAVTVQTDPIINVRCPVGKMCPVDIKWTVTNPSNLAVGSVTLRTQQGFTSLRTETGDQLTSVTLSGDERKYTAYVRNDNAGSESIDMVISVEYA